jgi:2-polyprenyl-3-methyl-5-hydroxy-6-metoxy-1,4-benzoquinol methylase
MQGMEVLDFACGHLRIANRLAQRGCRVTGLDCTDLFLQHARRDAEARGVLVTSTMMRISRFSFRLQVRSGRAAVSRWR